MRYILVLTLFLANIFAVKIDIAVAANLAYVMPELKKAFAILHPDIDIQTSLASSGVLTAQIKHGARYGLFLSADMKYPNYLHKLGLSLKKPELYAQGSLALFSSRKLQCTQKMRCLYDKKIRRVALGNPKTVPYGKAALDALKKAGLYKGVKSKLIFAESIAQALSYTLTAADVGIIATSSLYSLKMKQYKKNSNWIEVDEALYQPIEQAMVLLKTEKSSEAYQLFYDFLKSAKAKTILKSYGYKTL